MNRIRLAMALAGLLVGAACSGGGDDGPPDVAATVEGVEISAADTEELVDAYSSRIKEEGKEDVSRDRLAKLALGYQIKLSFLETLADKRGVKVRPKSYFDTAADVVNPKSFEALGLREQDFARSLRAGQLSEAIAADLFPNLTVSETVLRDEYDRRAANFKHPWKAKVGVALFDSQDTAGQVKGRVAGGEDFQEVAEELGASEVGDVDVDGFVAELPGPVLDTIGSLAVGSVSDAVSTGSGWISLLVHERDAQPVPTFEDLKAELTDALVQVERAQEFQKWFEEQFKKAKVTVDDHYGEWNAEVTAVV